MLDICESQSMHAKQRIFDSFSECTHNTLTVKR